VAINDRVKDSATGEWKEKPNFLNVDVFGAQADSCALYLVRGRQVGVSGKLRWREWETPEGKKREAITIVADTVQFLGAKTDPAPKPDAFDEAKAFVGESGHNVDGVDDDIPFLTD
jgi:single-strand DNA-binding protein